MQSRASSRSVPRRAERPPSRITRWSSSGPSASSAAPGAGDEVDVAGRVVADRRHREDLEDVGGLVPVAHHPLHPHHGHVDARQRGDQAGIALVLDHADRPGLGDGDVHAGDADVGGGEDLAQPHAGVGDQRLAVARERVRRSRPPAPPATWSLLRCTAGATMWLGCWPASCRIHSPRSVSTTRRPASSIASLSLISSVAIDFDLATSARPARRGQVGDVAAGGRRVGGADHDAAGGADVLLQSRRAARAGRGCRRGGSRGRGRASRRTGSRPPPAPAARRPAGPGGAEVAGQLGVGEGRPGALAQRRGGVGVDDRGAARSPGQHLGDVAGAQRDRPSGGPGR